MRRFAGYWGTLPLLLCLICAPYARGCWELGDTYEFGSSMYFLSKETKLDWGAAEHVCRRLGGDLARVDSAEEQEFLKEMLTSNDAGDTWIGLRAVTGAQNRVDNYKWTSGPDNVPYTKFRSGEPNNTSNTEYCTSMRKNYSYMWNNRRCKTSTSFVCEIQKD